MSAWSTWELAVLGWAIAAGVMFVLWCVQMRTHNATEVDVAWAANLGLIALVYAILAPGLPARRTLVATCVVIATWRLAAHLLFDRALGKPEDGRYRNLRAHWGHDADRMFFAFYQAQALLDAILSATFLMACTASRALGALDYCALALWLVAVVGESVADRQLARFKSNSANRGRTCRAGLWRYSRHPNYFFEWLTWVAYALFAMSAPWGWLGLASPLVMLFLILRVTGIPPTEAQALRTRGDDYRRYQRATSAFVPWIPRREGEQEAT